METNLDRITIFAELGNEYVSVPMTFEDYKQIHPTTAWIATVRDIDTGAFVTMRGEGLDTPATISHVELPE